MPELTNNGAPSLDRLQLVAALIEYDNDDVPPEKRRDHRQSAIFTQFRPRPLDRIDHRPDARPPPSRSQTLQPGQPRGVEEGFERQGPRPQSMVPAPRARDSMTMEILEGRQRFDPNMPRQDLREDGEMMEEQEELDVDVSRWGLPEHLVAQDDTPTSRPKSAMSASNQARPLSSLSRFQPRPPSTMLYLDDSRPTPIPFPAAHTTSINVPSITRARSVHLDIMNQSPDEYGADTALESAERVRNLVEGNTARERTRSGGDTFSRPDRGNRRVSFNELDMVDRPSTSQGLRSHSRLSSNGRTPPTSPPSMRPRSAMSRKPSNPLLVPLPPSPMHALMNRQSSYIPTLTAEEEELDQLADLDEPILSSEPNPFAMPPPPAVIGSRFDPKQLEVQRGASRLSDYARPTSSMSLQRSSLAQFDDMARTTTPAAALEYIEEQDLGDLRVYDDIPTAEQYGKPLQPPKYANARPQRLSRIDLLRPKTLMMPPSLANQPDPPSPPKKKWEIPPEGFSIGEKPLPKGARTSVLTLNGIPRIPMSLSQRTFRSSLLVGGERGEAWVGGADEDGEVGVMKRERDDLPPEAYERKAGKLYGKSLIDQLEARKAAMKGRQRYFTGDSRPAMMDRSSFAAQHDPSSATSPTGAQVPLLQFGDDGDLHRSPTSPDMPYHPSNNRLSHMPTSNSTSQLVPPRPIDRMSKSNSVFGIDQVWESEMALLKIRQAQEAEQARLVQEREEEEERRKKEKKDKKIKKDRKGKGKMRESDCQSQDQLAVDRDQGLTDDISPVQRVADLPPMLQFSPEKPPARSKPEPESDSDEDVPLSRIRNAKSRPSSIHPSTQQHRAESSDDSDVPLSRLRKSKTSNPNPPAAEKPALILSTDFAPTLDLGLESATGSLGLNLPVPQSASEMTKPTTEEIGEDDDVPLLLRQAHIKHLAQEKSNDDDDDVPLGVRQSMLLNSNSNTNLNGNMMSGFRPPDPALYAPAPNSYGYPNFQQQPHYPGSMYGYPPAPAPGWGSPMGMPAWPQQPMGYPYQIPPQHTGMSNPYQIPPQHTGMSNPYQIPPQHTGMGMQPQQTGLGGGMGMNIGQMSFPDLGAMMNAHNQSVPPSAALTEMGTGVQTQTGNIDSWRKGVDPVVPPAGSVGGGSRRS